ncbi:hypothetical protein [Leptolyngbya sp. O-77]|uniref:hypothetical protein n=1 Tax=Leptolyngbya sp. O-77 TaxID=1080068 RepID=UPI000AF62448|nr:hypothetical protein [Leptolyngbya sp. O-77]
MSLPEIWLYDSGTLQINVLQGDRSVESATSPTFPGLPIAKIIPNAVKRAKQMGTS